MKRHAQQPRIIPALALLLKSSTSFFCAVFELLTNVHMRPSRSHTHSRFVPGTHVSPTALVNIKFGNATTADQVPATTGAAGGRTPFKKGAGAGRLVSP